MIYKTGLKFSHSSGPHNAKMAFVGEAWGEKEEEKGVPFIGSSGYELTRMMEDVGIVRDQCFLTNVFAFRPFGNELENICGNREEVGKDYPMPALRTVGKRYVLPQYLPELARLWEELDEVKPNIIIGLGATAAWALLHNNKIGAIRGTVNVDGMGNKIICTYHPSAVLRNWSWRTTVLADLIKAKKHSESRDLERRSRNLLINPTMKEVGDWVIRAFRDAKMLSVDIETTAGMIDMIGFAMSPDDAICIPITIGKVKRYWSEEEEKLAWYHIRQLCESGIPKLFQNGLFDLQYLWRAGVRVNNCQHDTMILHHALYPEMNKGLGFLASVYCDESAWKLMRKREELKRDD